MDLNTDVAVVTNFVEKKKRTFCAIRDTIPATNAVKTMAVNITPTERRNSVKALSMSFADWKHYKDSLNNTRIRLASNIDKSTSLNKVTEQIQLEFSIIDRNAEFVSPSMNISLHQMQFSDDFMMPNHLPPQMINSFSLNYKNIISDYSVYARNSLKNDLKIANFRNKIFDEPEKEQKNHIEIQNAMKPNNNSDTKSSNSGHTQQLSKKKQKARNYFRKKNMYVQAGTWALKPPAPPPLDADTPQSREEKQRMWKEYRVAMKPYKNREFHNAKRCIQRLTKKDLNELDEKERERLTRSQKIVTSHKLMLTQKHTRRNASQQNHHVDEAQIFIKERSSSLWTKFPYTPSSIIIQKDPHCDDSEATNQHSTCFSNNFLFPSSGIENRQYPLQRCASFVIDSTLLPNP